MIRQPQNQVKVLILTVHLLTIKRMNHQIHKMMMAHHLRAVVVVRVQRVAVMQQLRANVTRLPSARVILLYVHRSINNGFQHANKPKHLQK